MKNLYFKFINCLYTRNNRHLTIKGKESCLRDAAYALLKFNLRQFKLEMRTFKNWKD